MTKESDKQAAASPSFSKGMRPGDPKWTPVLPSLRDNYQRSTFTTDPGSAGTVNFPSMYDLSKALLAGKWGKGGQWK